MAALSKRKQKWQELTQGRGPDAYKSYSLEESFTKGDIIDHKIFGTGYVKSSFESKIEVLFEDKKRVLVHKIAL